MLTIMIFKKLLHFNFIEKHEQIIIHTIAGMKESQKYIFRPANLETQLIDEIHKDTSFSLHMFYYEKGKLPWMFTKMQTIV